MKSKVMNFLQNPSLARQILSAVIFCMIFMGTAYLWKDTYYRYFDTVEYLSIDSPISVDKTFYKPCDLVAVSAGIEAKIDVEAIVLTELVLVKEDDGDYLRIDGSQTIQHAPFRKQDHHIVSSYLRLPCELPDGRYYWKGNATYPIRGYQRTESYVSETFNVTQTGLSPSGDNLQQQIDQLK